MEYYGIRKSGNDIDLIITDEDYQRLSREYPDKRKDIYGDLGVVIDRFEIWRSIVNLDYDFFKKDAVEEEHALVISIDRLLLSRVFATNIEKYRNDLLLMKEYYLDIYMNPEFYQEASLHEASYIKKNGIICYCL